MSWHFGVLYAKVEKIYLNEYDRVSVLKELNAKYKELFELGFFDFKGMKIPLTGNYKEHGTYKEILEILKEYKCK